MKGMVVRFIRAWQQKRALARADRVFPFNAVSGPEGHRGRGRPPQETLARRWRDRQERGAVLAHYQTGRFYDLRITDLCFSYHRKTGFIQEDGVLDGFYVIRTSVGFDTLSIILSGIRNIVLEPPSSISVIEN